MSLAAAAFHIVFFLNLDNLKKHLLRLVEIELSVKFSPPFANTFSVRRHYMKTELNKILESYPTTVNHTDIIDFDNFDERLSAVDTLVVNTIGVSEDIIEFIPDNEPPLKEEIYCWIWAIRPDLSKDLLNLDINEDFRILLKSYIDNDMSRFWNHMS